MPHPRLARLLAALEAARYQFNAGDGTKVEKLLRSLDRARFPDPASLIRFHEALSFVRAFPQSVGVLKTAERILNRFHEKVEVLRQSGADMDEFDTFEHSGIAGTTMEDTLSFDVARWLVRRLPGQVEIAWENYDPGRELGTTGPRFMPLLEDDAFVEADTPFRRWLETASGFRPSIRGSASQTGLAAKRRKSAAHGASRGYKAELLIKPRRGERKTAVVTDRATAKWLIDCLDRLPLPPQQKAELYESLRIPLRWHLGNSPITRTRNWRSPRKVFYHRGPLISRSQVSLAEELARRPPTFTRLSLREGERIADMIREVMLVRYRELYGTTLADPRSVVRVDFGRNTPAAPSLPRSLRQGWEFSGGEANSARGLEIYLWNLPPERRLPLRAYVAGFTLKNGVPINYIEAIGLCEWMEVGFNTFYTFRGGEAGWIYAQVLRCLCAWMGTTVVSVYPYQLGHDNEEAIESGAFWFYRKLGFRPGRPDLLKLAEREEKKIAASQESLAPQIRARYRGPRHAHGAVVERASLGTSEPARPYRTPATILKRLAAGHVFYELPHVAARHRDPRHAADAVAERANLGDGAEIGAWDRFSTRNIGLRVNETMAHEFVGDADRMRANARRALERALGVKMDSSMPEQTALDNFAFVLSLVPDLRTWSKQEKQDLLRIIRAKSNPDEMLYLHLTQRHARLRQALLKLGS